MPPKKSNSKKVIGIKTSARAARPKKKSITKKIDAKVISAKKLSSVARKEAAVKVCTKCGLIKVDKAPAVSENKKKLFPNSSQTKVKKPSSVIDPIFEIIDPNPDIQALFKEFDKEYFYGLLRKNKVSVQWSKRLKSSVGMCRDDYPPLISLSQPLLSLRPRKDTVETLLHEMIHAYLAVAPGQFEYEAHGPKFHKHMKRIDRLAGTKLEVDHDFHDEVEYNSYIWKCTGKCEKQVMSCYNRPPGEANVWWSEHNKICGGKFELKHDPRNNDKNKMPKPKSK